jgi:GNAT superfamily N-acetyltransferase
MTTIPVIRRATLADIEALARLRLALLREMGNIRDESQEAPLLDALRGYLQRTMATDQFLAWVAEVDGQVVAISGLVFFERPPDAGNPAGVEAYLMNMYTLPAWRGLGLARALLDEIIGHVRTTLARRISLHATDAGRPIYESAGFVPTTSVMELAW